MRPKRVRDTALSQSLNLFDATAISVGAIVGAGIYVVIGLAAGLAGPALLISMLIAAAVSSLTALSYAELSALIPREGGVYEFAHELLSPFWGFLTGWMWLVSNIFTGAAVSLGFAFYLAPVLPGVPLAATASVVCLALTLVNFIGVKRSATVNDALVVAKVLILCFFVLFGLLYVRPENFRPFVPSGTGVIYASVYIFFAFGGFARVAAVAEEVKDARRNVPKAILLSLAISTLLYVSVGLVAVGLVGGAGLSHSGSPLADAIDSTGNSYAFYLVSLGGLLATASVLLSSVLGVSRVMYSMARRGDLPRKLALVDSTRETPGYAVWVSGIIMIVLVLLVDLQRVVIVSSFALLFYYAVANAAALRVKGVEREYPRIVAVSGLIACLVLLVFVLFVSPNAMAIGAASLAGGAALYWLRGAAARSRSS